MKGLKNTLIVFAGLVLAGWFILKFSGNEHLIRGVRYTYLSGQKGPSIDEFHRFPTQEVNGGAPEPWPLTVDYNQYRPDPVAFASMEAFKSVAFAVFHCDSLMYEHYWEGYDAFQRSNSFSMAKSIVALAVGICLDQGLIHGLDDSVEYYLEDFKGTGLTIREVMQMRTNFNFGEKYGDPFGFVARAYYGKDQRKVMKRYEIIGQPGTKWEYLSGNTLILSMLVEKVSGQTIADFVSEHIWQHLGPEQPAMWNIDETGMTKSFCCFISTARDFARFGKLVMARGYWNGKQIISPEFIDEMLRPVMVRDGEGNMVDYYGMQWWLGHYRDQNFFYMRGMLGQYVICFPESDLIIVRLGHQRSKEKINNIPADMFGVMDAGWSILDQRP